MNTTYQAQVKAVEGTLICNTGWEDGLEHEHEETLEVGITVEAGQSVRILNSNRVFVVDFVGRTQGGDYRAQGTDNRGYPRNVDTRCLQLIPYEEIDCCSGDPRF